MKILVMTDNPSIDTGMARVGKNVALSLCEVHHQVVYIGWFQCEQTQNWPFTLYQCPNSTYGRDIFDEVILKERPDVVLTIGDPWTYDYIANSSFCKTRGLFQWVGYTAVDGEAFSGGVPQFWAQVILNMDRIVAYTDYGKEAILKTFPQVKNRIDIIYHGFDNKEYYPLAQEEIIKQRAKLNTLDKVVYLAVARNQGRKNWPEIFKAWRKVIDRGNCPNAYLWPHTYFYDNAGHNIDNILNELNLINSKSIIFFESIARGQSAVKLLPENMLNILYNCSDVFLSASGEGFGLPIIEAMGCKLPCIVLDESATKELGAEGRAYKIKTKLYITGRYMSERPVPDVDQMVEVIEQSYKEIKHRKVMAEKAYHFAINYTNNNISQLWKNYFYYFSHRLAKPIILEEV